MANITLGLKDNFREFDKSLKRWPGAMREAMVEGFRRASEIVVKAAQLNLTSNKSVAFGLLRASMGYQLDESALKSVIGPGLSSKGFSISGEKPTNYGFFVEHGRKPGKPPPPRVLELWVKRKLGVSGEEDLARVEFLVARKIAKEGVQPAPFLVPALRDNEGKVKQRIAKSLNDKISQMNSRGNQ